MKASGRAPKVGDFEKTLNLVSLARTGDGAAQAVPGTPFEVSSIVSRTRQRLPADRWLLLISGELIVDLPHGDFRIMAPGDSLRLPAGLEIGCQPVEPAVVLWAPTD